MVTYLYIGRGTVHQTFMDARCWSGNGDKKSKYSLSLSLSMDRPQDFLGCR